MRIVDLARGVRAPISSVAGPEWISNSGCAQTFVMSATPSPTFVVGILRDV